MTAALVQEANSIDGSGGTSLTRSVNLTGVGAGNTIHILGCTENGANPTFVFTATVGTPAATLDFTNDGGGIVYAQSYILNSAGGNITFTVTTTAAHRFCGIWVREFSGVSTSATPDHSSATPASSATPSGNITVSVQPSIVSALCADGNNVNPPTVGNIGGSAATAGATGWSLAGVGLNNFGFSEHRRVTATGVTACTFGISPADITSVMMMAFQESGGAVVAPSIQQPIRHPGRSPGRGNSLGRFDQIKRPGVTALLAQATAFGATGSAAEASLQGSLSVTVFGTAGSAGFASLGGQSAFTSLGLTGTAAFANAGGSLAFTSLGTAGSAGEANLQGVLSFTAFGTAGTAGEAQPTGSAAVVAFGTTGTAGLASLVGTGAMQVFGSDGTAGFAALLAAGSLAPITAFGASGSASEASLTGLAGLVSLGTTGTAGFASMTGSAALQSLGTAGSAGFAGISATLSLTAFGTAGSAGFANLQALGAGSFFAFGTSGSAGFAEISFTVAPAPPVAPPSGSPPGWTPEGTPKSEAKLRAAREGRKPYPWEATGEPIVLSPFLSSRETIAALPVVPVLSPPTAGESTPVPLAALSEEDAAILAIFLSLL